MDAGINFFDTANAYGRGVAEEAWGEILSDYPRGSFVLATKLYWPMADDHAGGLSAAEVRTRIDASLARLRTDYVDLYQCHRFDVATPIEETMECSARWSAPARRATSASVSGPPSKSGRPLR